jgi:deoxyadenosine/deoxycytidine kinase
MDNLSERDYQSYRRVYDMVVAGLPKPDLLLYLKAPVPVLLNRIQRRGREMEKGITSEYLTLLETFYEEWMDAFDLCPVLTIPTENLDFVHKSKHMDIVEDRIQDKLAGREAVVFPPNANDA